MARAGRRPARRTWSQPSHPAAPPSFPSTGPPSPRSVGCRAPGRTVRIGVDVPTELRGGPLGSYRVELYRQLPGEREQLLATIAEQQRPAGDGPWPLSTTRRRTAAARRHHLSGRDRRSTRPAIAAEHHEEAALTMSRAQPHARTQLDLESPALGPWFDDTGITLRRPDADLAVAVTPTTDLVAYPPATGLLGYSRGQRCPGRRRCSACAGRRHAGVHRRQPRRPVHAVAGGRAAPRCPSPRASCRRTATPRSPACRAGRRCATSPTSSPLTQRHDTARGRRAPPITDTSTQRRRPRRPPTRARRRRRRHHARQRHSTR